MVSSQRVPLTKWCVARCTNSCVQINVRSNCDQTAGKYEIRIQWSKITKIKHITSQDPTKLDIESIWFDELKEVYNDYMEVRQNMSGKEESNLQQFWMSFLDILELLLNTIFSIWSGNWELLLECMRCILPYAFTYDNLNYIRYLNGMLGERYVKN